MNTIATMLTRSVKSALLVLAAAACAPAQATVIVDHSNDGIDNGFTVWDDFTLTSAATLNAITYFTNNTGPGWGDYTLSIGTAA